MPTTPTLVRHRASPPMPRRPSPRRGPERAATNRRGQATTEWMLLIAVVVVAMVAAGYGLAGTFGASMSSLGERASEVYTSGDLAR